MLRSAATLLLTLACASTALADEILLRNGHKITGIQREERDRIVVETGYGTVSFPRDEVVSVTKGQTALHAWPVRFAEIEKSTNASDFTKLAAWAKENSLPRYVGPMMRRALELDPENAEARAALGYVRRDGRWLSQDEQKKQQGRVNEGGRWVHPLEKELAERRRLESESRKIDRETERRAKDETRRRAREDRELQAQITAAVNAPTAYEPHMGYGYYGHSPYGYGWGGYWGGAYDIMMVDWLLAYRASGSFFPLTRQIVMPPGAPPPPGGGSLPTPLPVPLP
jgi:hypothetical protein